MVSDMHNRERPRVCVSRRTTDGTRWNFSFREMVGANPERTEFFRIEERETIDNEKEEEENVEEDENGRRTRGTRCRRG